MSTTVHDAGNTPAVGAGAPPRSGSEASPNPSRTPAMRLQQHLNRWLIVYALAMMAAGLAVGYPVSGWTGAHPGGIGTATTIAATAFSPLVAVPAATMPIFQVILMIGYLKLAPRLRRYFTSAPASTPAGATR